LRERFAFVNAAARTEDVARAEATVRLTEAQIKEAQARISEAQARLDKTFIRSPIDGVVLRKHLKRGESVDASSGTPIVTVADVATLRVRADVDEADVGKIQVGQQAYVTAKAYGDQKFWGRVVRIGQSVGKKNFRTDEPSERVDTKILETLVELEPGSKLPPGLRVDTFIIVSGPTTQTNTPTLTVSPT
jgi:multidrug resistance efflux pump